MSEGSEIPNQPESPVVPKDRLRDRIDLGAKPPRKQFMPGEEEGLRQMAEAEQEKDLEWLNSLSQKKRAEELQRRSVGVIPSGRARNTSGFGNWQRGDINDRGTGER